MTERKPRGMSFESWVERQIREAQERGAFDNLAGAGKPLPKDSDDALGWVLKKLDREGLDRSVLLPESLALAKEVEDLPHRLATVRSEQRVRDLVTDLNARIQRVRLGPQVGPPLRARPLDVDEVVDAWRAARESG